MCSLSRSRLLQQLSPFSLRQRSGGLASYDFLVLGFQTMNFSLNHPLNLTVLYFPIK